MKLAVPHVYITCQVRKSVRGQQLANSVTYLLLLLPRTSPEPEPLCLQGWVFHLSGGGGGRQEGTA